MKLLITSAVFRRLHLLDQKFKEKLIPFEWILKYSKTEGYVLVIHGDTTTDSETIALWPLYKDFDALITTIEKMGENK